jgi:Clostripain family
MQTTKFNNFLLGSIFACLLIFSACSKDSDDLEPDTNISKQTLIFYIQSNNNLYSALWGNIAEMAVINRSHDNNNVLVFIDSEQGSRPNSEGEIKTTPKNQLLLIEGNGIITPVEGFADQFKDKDPSSVTTFKEVLEYCTSHFKAQKYGLMMSSHGNGWFPFDTKVIGGNDITNRYMEIDQIAAALPVKFEYIGFDACLMNDIETVYEFHDKANYIIGSVISVPGTGFDYSTSLLYLLNGYYETVCDKLVTEYRVQGYEIALTVTEAAKLPALASKMKQLLTDYPCQIESAYELSQLPTYENELTYVDFAVFASCYFKNETAINDLMKPLDAARYYTNASFLTQEQMENYSGYSIWVPNFKKYSMDNYVKRLGKYKWYKDSGAEKYLSELQKID